MIDLAGAYDNVDWELLLGSMRAMGFNEAGHVRWAQLLHRGRKTWLHREERDDWKERRRSSHQSSDTRQAPWTAALSRGATTPNYQERTRQKKANA
jgi:hypothetical protein